MFYPSIESSPLPDESFLKRFDSGPSDGGATAYIDCFACEITDSVTFEHYVHMFYTTPVFKLERSLLNILGGYASSDQDARQLAAGEVERFSAWHVEDRGENQLLLSDVSGRTRSWLMVDPAQKRGENVTRLLFGSAVLPIHNRKTGRYALGIVFHALLGFHRLYSRILLGAARKKLRKQLDTH